MKKMILIFASFAAVTAFAVTASREYVDSQDAATFEAATNAITKTVTKSYVEGLGITGGGGSSIEVDKTLSVSGAAADAKKVGDWFEGMGEDFRTMQYVASAAESKAGSALSKADAVSLWAKGHELEFNGVDAKASTAFSLANEAKTSASSALAYASGIFTYMNAQTNAWFSGTNYVVGAAANTRHRFAFESGMDLSAVPCSMALMELRDGVKQTVWDQRDWVSWYWSFKSSQMMGRINETNRVIYAAISNRADKAWSRTTAGAGLDNPDRSTTWIDTPSVTLAPGMAWERQITVDGCAYWTIRGNATIGGKAGEDGAGVLEIADFEGKPVMTVTKGSSKLVYLECGSDIYTSGRDAAGRITFTMRSDVQPIGEFSTVLDVSTFVEETDEGCPADYEWEKVTDGVYRIHFLKKPTISASACFARFKASKVGETKIQFAALPEVSGGLIVNGVKIAPEVSEGAAVGTVVTWKVVK